MRLNPQKTPFGCTFWLIHHNIFFNIGQLPLSFFISGENLIEAGGDPILALRNLDKNLQLFLLLIPSLVGFSGTNFSCI